MRSCISRFAAALLLFTMLLPVYAQKHTYQSFNGNVPFSFSIGDRKFHAGFYEFVVTGPGLMVMRDAHAHVIATLMTRPLEGQERSVEPRFVFSNKKGNLHLASIWMEKGASGYEIVGEDIAMQAQRGTTPSLPMRPPVFQMPSTLH